MKRIAAILLMGMLFFNWCGYCPLSSWLEERANRQLEARLDEDRYDESQLITFKVPASRLAYFNSSTRFERMAGQIEVGGVQYMYVKCRLFNDSMEIECIVNHTGMNLQKVRNQFFQLVNDTQQHNGQGKRSNNHSTVKNFSPTDYYTEPGPAMSLYVAIASRQMGYDQTPPINTSCHFTVEQPPDHFSC